MGFPTNLRALYVDQLEVAEGCSSVLEVVMNADKEVLTWRKQAQLLQVHMLRTCLGSLHPQPNLHVQDMRFTKFLRKGLKIWTPWQ